MFPSIDLPSRQITDFVQKNELVARPVTTQRKRLWKARKKMTRNGNGTFAEVGTRNFIQSDSIILNLELQHIYVLSGAEREQRGSCSAHYSH